MKMPGIKGSLLLLAVLLLAVAPPWAFSGDSDQKLANGDKIKTTGVIQNFGDDYILVNDYTFAITDGTKFKNGTKADMAVGKRVQVTGRIIAWVRVAEGACCRGDQVPERWWR